MDVSTNNISVKVKVVECDDYVMYLEDYGSLPWFHTDIFKWTPEIKKSFLDDLDNLQRQLPVPIIAISLETNKKLLKFGKSIGFKYQADFVGQDGNTYNIYSRSL